jgi:Na+/proline symporter
MSPLIALSILFIYFSILILISIKTSKNADSASFFLANKAAPWYLVAFGMIGTSISGVTFVSVPGKVGAESFGYFQMVLGFVLGYLFIGTVLMPLYYRLNLISIYQFFQTRFGYWSYKTGSAIFLISRTIGSAVRLYVAVSVLQMAIFGPIGIPFELSVIFTILLIWVYTFKGGVKTILITDTLQTFFLIAALITTIFLLKNQMGWGLTDMFTQIGASDYSKIFHFDQGWSDKQNFFKLFISGMFITIVMTGMDQDLMQKNLSCKNIKEAQKNMLWFTVTLVVVNLLFLSLGAMLFLYANKTGIQVPANSDEFYPMMALEIFNGPEFGIAGMLVGITFLIGITAATYASSDSALTALTTAFSVDFMNVQQKTEEETIKIKNRVHVGFSIVFVIVIMIFHAVNSTDLITAIYKIASYTYGPLLGLFAFGIFSKKAVWDKAVPYICFSSPVITYLLEQAIQKGTGYKFGFENLLLNGLITILGLALFGKKEK